MPFPLSVPTEALRYRIQVNRPRPHASVIDWAPSLSAAKKVAAQCRQNIEPAGSWTDWQILDLKELIVVDAGENPRQPPVEDEANR